MAYTAEDLERMAVELGKWRKRGDGIALPLMAHPYTKEESRIVAQQGTGRRIHTLVHCIDRLFACLPPEQQEPSRDAMNEATIYLQAFIINVYGTLDNLARIWSAEREIKTEKGKPIPEMFMGLGPAHELVRASLSAGFQEYLVKCDPWFEYLENYRHALAHRIPLYIPPRTLGTEAQKEYRALADAKDAASKAGDYRGWDELNDKQDRVGLFSAVMMHSFGETDRDGKPIFFHSQVICDLATIVEISEMMLAELKAPPAAAAPQA